MAVSVKPAHQVDELRQLGHHCSRRGNKIATARAVQPLKPRLWMVAHRYQRYGRA